MVKLVIIAITSFRMKCGVDSGGKVVVYCSNFLGWNICKIIIIFVLKFSVTYLALQIDIRMTCMN